MRTPVADRAPFAIHKDVIDSRDPKELSRLVHPFGELAVLVAGYELSPGLLWLQRNSCWLGVPVTKERSEIFFGGSGNANAHRPLVVFKQPALRTDEL